MIITVHWLSVKMKTLRLYFTLAPQIYSNHNKLPPQSLVIFVWQGRPPSPPPWLHHCGGGGGAGIILGSRGVGGGYRFGQKSRRGPPVWNNFRRGVPRFGIFFVSFLLLFWLIVAVITQLFAVVGKIWAKNRRRRFWPLLVDFWSRKFSPGGPRHPPVWTKNLPGRRGGGPNRPPPPGLLTKIRTSAPPVK